MQRSRQNDDDMLIGIKQYSIGVHVIIRNF